MAIEQLGLGHILEDSDSGSPSDSCDHYTNTTGRQSDHSGSGSGESSYYYDEEDEEEKDEMTFQNTSAPSKLIVPQVDNEPYNEAQHKNLNELNFILVGDTGVGKTQLIKVYSGKQFD